MAFGLQQGRQFRYSYQIHRRSPRVLAYLAESYPDPRWAEEQLYDEAFGPKNPHKSRLTRSVARKNLEWQDDPRIAAVDIRVDAARQLAENQAFFLAVREQLRRGPPGKGQAELAKRLIYGRSLVDTLALMGVEPPRNVKVPKQTPPAPPEPVVVEHLLTTIDTGMKAAPIKIVCSCGEFARTFVGPIVARRAVRKHLRDNGVIPEGGERARNRTKPE